MAASTIAAERPGSTSGAAPLAGLRVLDLTQFLSGPYATQILGDLGAEVIKIEPHGGDSSRTIPPHFVGQDSAYYLSVNRNKKSVAVDMKHAAGKDVVRELALRSDVLIENFRPGVAAKLGLDYAQLVAMHPALIWCSISGFGQDGPYRELPAYDMIVQALSGGMSLTGETGGLPVRSGVPLGDLAAGMFAVIAIQAALVERTRTNKGKQIDISMLDCQVSMLTYQAAYHLIAGVVPGTQGRAHDSFATYRTFVAGDGVNVVVCANTDRMWEDMAAELGVAPLLDDARFKTNGDRHANRDVLIPALDRAFLAHPAAHWVERFRARGIPVGRVNTLDKALADPQVAHRQMVLPLDDGRGHRIAVAGNPIRFADQPRALDAYPPTLGEHSAAVLAEVLQWDAQRIAQLVAAGVLKTASGALAQASA
ncbi:MAG: CoA transferase [Proteobacteria bacterium]|nr:CoA transferase [Burkholderiales bacterium]